MSPFRSRFLKGATKKRPQSPEGGYKERQKIARKFKVWARFARMVKVFFHVLFLETKLRVLQETVEVFRDFT